MIKKDNTKKERKKNVNTNMWLKFKHETKLKWKRFRGIRDKLCENRIKNASTEFVPEFYKRKKRRTLQKKEKSKTMKKSTK